MLHIEDLYVEVGGNEVLKGVNLSIKKNETFILFGPNGSGKTTLLMTIMGFSNYKVTSGRIIFIDVDITYLPIYERARLGIGMSFQRPPTINGLKTKDLVRLCARGRDINVEEMAKRVNMVEFLERDINAGFSGGEIKRSELLQLMAQQPKLLLFDEPESGVDVENMVLIGDIVKELLGQKLTPINGMSMKEQKQKREVSGLIITHTGYILDYINADRGMVMYEGRLCCEARPRDILEHIRKYGYKECMKCLI